MAVGCGSIFAIGRGKKVETVVGAFGEGSVREDRADDAVEIVVEWLTRCKATPSAIVAWAFSPSLFLRAWKLKFPERFQELKVSATFTGEI